MHDNFRYHISLCYLVKSLNDTQKQERDKLCYQMTTMLKNTIKPFVITNPEFVIFNDMMSYEVDLKKRGNKY